MTIALVCLAFAAGAAIAWFLTKGQVRFRVSEAVAQLEAKTREAEARAIMLSEQTGRYESDLKELRGLLSKESESKTAAMTRLEESLKNIEEQKKNLEAAQKTFEQTLENLSNRAIKNSSEEFLGQAKNVVAPLEAVLKRYEEQVNSLEKANVSVGTQISSLIQSNQLLQKEAGALAAAFKNPNIRGQWGQFSLKRIVELAGMTEHCDFTEQVSVQSDEGRLRPDMVISLPGGTQVVVDSKVVLQAYRDEYLTAADEAARKNALLKHSQQMRKHMMDLSSKSYWNQFEKAPEFVVMFVPGEPFVSAACEFDSSLIEDGIASRIIIAAPTTLITLLRSIAMGWRQEEVTKNTQQIAELGKQLYERFATFAGHLAKTRNSLEQSVFNFNRTVSSLEGRVIPSLRKFKELGATGADDLDSIEPIEQMPRQLGMKEEGAPEDLFSKKG